MVTRWDQKKDKDDDINGRAYSRTSKGLTIPQRGAGTRKALLRKPKQRVGSQNSISRKRCFQPKVSLCSSQESVYRTQKRGPTPKAPEKWKAVVLSATSLCNCFSCRATVKTRSLSSLKPTPAPSVLGTTAKRTNVCQGRFSSQPRRLQTSGRALLR